jgi:hypothetical protein
MSIMDMFKNAMAQKPLEGANSTATADPNNPTVPKDSAPASSAPAQADDATKSPLDAFGKLWENDPNKKDSAGDFKFNVDPAKLQEAVSKANFVQAIPQENLAKIAAGGDDAVKAFAESLNLVAQNVLAQSTMASSKMVENALSKANESLNARLPNMMKQYQLTDNMQNENPALSHPAAQPLIEAVKSQLTIKHPDATTIELTKMAKEYLTAFAGLVNPAAPPADTKGGKGKANDVDWESFLSE